MANTEDIEARLCAYIDGQLDSRERAEIEQHLAAHPEHRVLLEELSRHRDLLRQLPRESAPDDLYESFTGQLERSVLLDSGPQEHLSIGGRPNRWSQVYAVAAVLFLAVGLGAVIYFVLPRHSLEETNFAIGPAATQPIHLSTEGAAAIKGEQPMAMETHSTAVPATENSRRFAFADSDLSSPATDKTNPIAPMDAGQTSALFAGGESGALSQAAPEQQLKPVVLVMNTADIAAAESQLTHFLAQNQIDWQRVDQSQANEIALLDGQKAQMDRVAQRQVKLKQPMQAVAATQPAIAPASQPSLLATAATTQPLASGSTTQPASINPPLPPGEGWGEGENQHRPQNVILARNLTGQQVRDLKTYVATIEPTHEQKSASTTRPATLPSMVVSNNTGKPLPATHPGGILQAGDVLSITNSDSDQVSIESVSSDGTVTLPNVGEVSVAGLTVDQAANNLTKALADKNSGNARLTIRVIRGGGSAATEPANLAMAQRAAPASQPAPATTQPSKDISATTQSLAEEQALAPMAAPAAPMTQPAETRMDVVIVVQPDFPAQTPPAASTQPALSVNPPTTAPATAPDF